jgi:hypothetical protein
MHARFIPPQATPFLIRRRSLLTSCGDDIIWREYKNCLLFSTRRTSLALFIILGVLRISPGPPQWGLCFEEYCLPFSAIVCETLSGKFVF